MMSQIPQIQYQRPTKQDILVVSTTVLVSISLLSLAIHTLCVHLHTQPVVWLVLLIVLWFPTIVILGIFPLSRWPVKTPQADDEPADQMVPHPPRQRLYGWNLWNRRDIGGAPWRSEPVLKPFEVPDFEELSHATIGEQRCQEPGEITQRHGVQAEIRAKGCQRDQQTDAHNDSRE